jgi:hypothetical protein
MADFKASASDSTVHPISSTKSVHDDVYKYSADGTKLTLEVRTDADLVAAEVLRPSPRPPRTKDIQHFLISRAHSALALRYSRRPLPQPRRI